MSLREQGDLAVLICVDGQQLQHLRDSKKYEKKLAAEETATNSPKPKRKRTAAADEDSAATPQETANNPPKTKRKRKAAFDNDSAAGQSATDAPPHPPAPPTTTPFPPMASTSRTIPVRSPQAPRHVLPPAVLKQEAQQPPWKRARTDEAANTITDADTLAKKRKLLDLMHDKHDEAAADDEDFPRSLAEPPTFTAPIPVNPTSTTTYSQLNPLDAYQSRGARGGDALRDSRGALRVAAPAGLPSRPIQPWMTSAQVMQCWAGMPGRPGVGETLCRYVRGVEQSAIFFVGRFKPRTSEDGSFEMDEQAACLMRRHMNTWIPVGPDLIALPIPRHQSYHADLIADFFSVVDE